MIGATDYCPVATPLITSSWLGRLISAASIYLFYESSMDNSPVTKEETVEKAVFWSEVPNYRVPLSAHILADMDSVCSNQDSAALGASHSGPRCLGSALPNAPKPQATVPPIDPLL